MNRPLPVFCCLKQSTVGIPRCVFSCARESRDASRAWLVHGYKKVRLLSSRGQAWGSGCPEPYPVTECWDQQLSSLLICKQVPAQWLQSSAQGCDPRRKFSRRRVSSPLPFLHQLTFLPVTCDSFGYPHPRWYLGLLYFKLFASLKWYLKFVLVLISLNISSYLYWPFLLPSMICVVIIFAHFSIGLLVFSVLTLKSSLTVRSANIFPCYAY